jgi:hypothetical protein
MAVGPPGIAQAQSAVNDAAGSISQPPPPRPITNNDISRQTVGWVVTAGGGICLVGSAYTLIVQDRKRDRFVANNGTRRDLREVQTYRTMARVLFAAGVVGIGVGLPLALIGNDDTRIDVGFGNVALSGTF